MLSLFFDDKRLVLVVAIYHITEVGCCLHRVCVSVWKILAEFEIYSFDTNCVTVSSTKITDVLTTVLQLIRFCVNKSEKVDISNTAR